MKLNVSAYAAEAAMSPVSNTPSLIIIGPPSVIPAELGSQPRLPTLHFRLVERPTSRHSGFHRLSDRF
jgi:hypothetical protein